MPRLVVGLIVTVMMLPCGWAVAEEPSVDGYYSGRIVITDHADGVAEQQGTTADRPVYAYWTIVYTSAGFCRERRFTYDQAEAAAYNSVFELRAAEASELTNLDACPEDVLAAAPPSPGQLARDFWDVRHLPSPTLRVVPDDAIVGKRVYLEIGGVPSTTFDVPNPIGDDVVITATSRYVVDWGDGTPPTTTTSRGGPWPDGDVTHVYDTARATAVILVRQEWSATWNAGPGAAGTLENLQTVGELRLRVDQLQPVRNR